MANTEATTPSVPSAAKNEVGQLGSFDASNGNSPPNNTRALVKISVVPLESDRTTTLIVVFGNDTFSLVAAIKGWFHVVTCAEINGVPGELIN